MVRLGCCGVHMPLLWFFTPFFALGVELFLVELGFENLFGFGCVRFPYNELDLHHLVLQGQYVRAGFVQQFGIDAVAFQKRFIDQGFSGRGESPDNGYVLGIHGRRVLKVCYMKIRL